MGLIHWLSEIDSNLFSWVHHSASMPILDPVFLMLRNASTWIPLYLYLLYWVIRYHRNYSIPFIVLSIAVFASGDLLSARLFKPLFERPRPCYSETLAPIIRNLIPCGGYYSLPSSHATNHFALAGFWFMTIKTLNLQKHYTLFAWAAVIGYAQVYVGKHYPLDILAGAVLGLCIGWAFSKFFLFVCKKIRYRNGMNFTKA